MSNNDKEADVKAKVEVEVKTKTPKDKAAKVYIALESCIVGNDYYCPNRSFSLAEGVDSATATQLQGLIDAGAVSEA